MFEKVSKELLKKAMKAKTKDEALAILKEGGVELTDEDLKSIAGGEGEDKICWENYIPDPTGGLDGQGKTGIRCTWHCTNFY